MYDKPYTLFSYIWRYAMYGNINYWCQFKICWGRASQNGRKVQKFLKIEISPLLCGVPINHHHLAAHRLYYPRVYVQVCMCGVWIVSPKLCSKSDTKMQAEEISTMQKRKGCTWNVGPSNDPFSRQDTKFNITGILCVCVKTCGTTGKYVL